MQAHGGTTLLLHPHRRFEAGLSSEARLTCFWGRADTRVVEGIAEHVDRHFRLGRDHLVANDRAVFFDLRVLVVRDERVVVTGPASALETGMRVTRRAGGGAATESVTLLVEEVETTTPAWADAVLAGERHDAVGAGGGDRRFSYDAIAMARLVDVVSAERGGSAAVRLAEISRTAFTFITDDRYGRGENLDVAFTDEGGGMIHLRATVAGPERSTYGRLQHVAEISAIGEADTRRLDSLCSRCRLRDDAALAGGGGHAALRSLLTPEPSTLRRAFGKR